MSLLIAIVAIVPMSFPQLEPLPDFTRSNQWIVMFISPTYQFSGKWIAFWEDLQSNHPAWCMIVQQITLTGFE